MFELNRTWNNCESFWYSLLYCPCEEFTNLIDTKMN